MFFYRLPKQAQFIETVNDNFHKLGVENKEVYILGDLNINILVNGKYLFDKNKDSLVGSNTFDNLSKQYKDFGSNFSLIQLIKSSTRITCNSSTLIDHTFSNTPEKVKQCGIINTSISDYQLKGKFLRVV